MTQNTPILKELTESFGRIPFNEVKTKYFIIVLDAAIDEEKAEMDAMIEGQN